jgi:large subunit ribosomal protein L6
LPLKNIICKVYKLNSKTFLIVKYLSIKKNISVVKTLDKFLKNLILGLFKGFYIKLAIKGIGYKVVEEKGVLNVFLGYSHPSLINLPKNCKILMSKNFLVL